MAFELKPLPFPKESLGPTMSTSTLEHHHGKHHAAYVKKLNELIAGTKFEKSDLESIVRATARSQAKEKKIFNNAAQVWNHDFFWESIAPNGGGTLPDPVHKRINASFVGRSFRQRLGMARCEGRQAGDRHDSRCRQSADVGSAGAMDLRPVGARVLSRLPARARGVREGSDREHRELAVRRQAAGGGRQLRPEDSGCSPAYRELTRKVAVRATKRATNSGVPYTPCADVRVAPIALSAATTTRKPRLTRPVQCR
jgi:hypothetical protein